MGDHGPTESFMRDYVSYAKVAVNDQHFSLLVVHRDGDWLH